jgi:iron(III) transport system ATP-binding protein
VPGLSFEVPKGGTLGILGPSGCGKTTLLRLLAGLEMPDEGEIWFGDRLASSGRRIHLPAAKRHMGFVFQDLALWPHMTVAGNLLFVLESQSWPATSRKGRIDEMLRTVGLEERAGDYPSRLSGGEQQRVAIARALVGRPDFLLLDEPLTSLDPDRRVAVRSEIASIVRTHEVTMIYVTHDRADAEALGGELLIMNQAGITERQNL